ncbi:excisionase family DNA-binding protein [Nocardia sp. IBHARD005]|uniref:excisionase family DNA-binding protein n=1 Tax=Nocardia sp. IBHARD005 TaxID=3457765 RepID=UPI004057DB58
MSRRSPKRTPNPSRYVSIKLAAERAGVSADTIRRMIAEGSLPAYRFRAKYDSPSRTSMRLCDRSTNPTIRDEHHSRWATMA